MSFVVLIIKLTTNYANCTNDLTITIRNISAIRSANHKIQSSNLKVQREKSSILKVQREKSSEVINNKKAAPTKGCRIRNSPSLD